MSAYYIDTSAALKLIAEESHSHAFAEFYDRNAGTPWVSSALLRVELIRAVGRTRPALLPDARALLPAFDYIAIDEQVMDAAMVEPDRSLRSLDAIHLASARQLGSDLSGLATYDIRLALAASAQGIPVIDPQD